MGTRYGCLGRLKDGPLRSVRAESLAELIRRTVGLGELESQRFVAAEIDRLDSERIAGVVVRGLGTEHLLATRLPRSPRWSALADAAPGEGKAEWRDILTDLGYELERLPQRGWLARYEGKAIMVVHPKGSASEFARLDEGARLPEGALLADCEHRGAPYGLMAAGSRLMNVKSAQGFKKKTVRNHITFAGGCLGYAVKRGWLQSNPIDLVERPRVGDRGSDIRYLTVDELQRVRAAVPDDLLGPTDRAVYSTAAMAGLRQGELIALRIATGQGARIHREWVSIDAEELVARLVASR